MPGTGKDIHAMPRKSTLVVASEPCSDCEGTGETEQAVTSRRDTVRGQMGVCLTCLGAGTTRLPPTVGRTGQINP
jgi:DnaJ-class molecular chaperone